MRDVTGIGTGSNIHQTAQSVATKPVQQALVSHPASCSEKNTAAAMSGPMISIEALVMNFFGITVRLAKKPIIALVERDRPT